MSDRVQNLYRDKIKAVTSAYEKGSAISSIADKVGVSPPTVSKWLIKEGYKRKGKGRVPLAMKARVSDLSQRGWNISDICSLLKLNNEQVIEWSKPQKNPILGGEKDPLKIKDQKRKRKSKKRKSKKLTKKKWPPKRHCCGKHWTAIEKAYVLQLIENNIQPLLIYQKTRASRKRQTKIWRESGGTGMPPNFPPPKPPPTLTAKLAGDRADAKELREASAKRLMQLERAYAEQQERIAELESQIIELEAQRKRLKEEKIERTERLAQAKAALEKRGKLPKSERRRVLPGSYEAEVLGLKPGSLIDPGKPGRPALERPRHLGEYADNGNYFTVSNEWADLEDASQDELELFASFLTDKGFPTKVESQGDQPIAYFESTWPKRVESKWLSSVDKGLNLLDKYRDRKEKLKSKKMYSKGIASYLAKAYEAYADPSLTTEQKIDKKEELLDYWARLKKIDRLILIFSMKMAHTDGSPTTKGVERGRAAKMLLERESIAAANRLAEKQRAKKEREQLRETERSEVEAILSGAKKALKSGEE